MKCSVIENKSVVLKEIEADDIEMVRQWRNSPDIRQYMLTQYEISQEQQQQWFKKITASEDQQHFVIYYRDEKIGVANIKGVDSVSIETQTVLEAAIYIASEKYRNTLVAFLPAIVLNDYCFDELGCEKLVATVLPENKAALRFNQTLGYEITSQEGLVKMALVKASFIDATTKMRRLLR